jgi:hypothetical protein
VGNNIDWGNEYVGTVSGKSTVWGMAAEDPAHTVWRSLGGVSTPTSYVLVLRSDRAVARDVERSMQVGSEVNR